MRSLIEQADSVADGHVSPVELVQQAIDAIQRTQPTLNAFTAILADDALKRAKELEAVDPVGPLHGVPIALKDLYDMRGVPTTGCCDAYRGRVAGRDSALAEALHEAGAIVVGKTNMHELAFGTTTQISCFGAARNPWDPDHVPGGSSGGSGAAVAAGVVAMAMGSDTGGSIRIPSSLCGVTGLKPTHGAVSLRGALPMTASLDTGGPLAVTARDCLLVHEIVGGFDPDYIWSAASSASDQPARPRIALARGFLAGCDESTTAAVERAAARFEDLGYVLDEIDQPAPDGVREAVFALIVGEFANHFRDLWDDERVSAPIKALLDIGRSVTGAEVAASREAALAVRREFEWALTAADALLAPCTPHAAPSIADDDPAAGLAVRTLPVNVAGFPAVAFPVGFTADGLPLGAQLVGRPWSEPFLCGVVAAYQDDTDHHLRRPDVG